MESQRIPSVLPVYFSSVPLGLCRNNNNRNLPQRYHETVRSLLDLITLEAGYTFDRQMMYDVISVSLFFASGMPKSRTSVLPGD